MKYRFLGCPDEKFPNLEYGKSYTLVVRTAFWSGKPRILKPFYCPYDSWLAFYRNWRPITIATMKLENLALDKETKRSFN
jgi:hypothetical protein